MRSWSIMARCIRRCSAWKCRGWIAAEWGTSDRNRKARFYELTRKGRKQLVAESGNWRRLTAAIGLILGPQEA